MFVRRGIDHYAVSVSGLQHLAVTVIHQELATRLVKLVVACVSPTRPLIEEDLTDGLQGNHVVHDEDAIDKCVEELTSAIQEATAASAHKRVPPADSRPPLPASIQGEIRAKNRLRKQWQVTRDPALNAEVNRLQRSVTYRLNEWRNEQWIDTLESLESEDQSLWKWTKRVMRVPTPLPPL
jgi:hypothetical protein